MKHPSALSLISLSIFFFLFSCQKEKSIENGLRAKGILQSEATGECLNKFVSGTYIVNRSLNDTNYLEVEVDVAAAGSYSISTTEVNGISFKSTGKFSNTGINVVKLAGTGKPLTEGIYVYSVSFDSSNCQVEVEVLPSGSTGGPPGNTANHFPLTLNSKWTYDDPFAARDTVKRVNVSTTLLAGKTYQKFEETEQDGTKTPYYYRKDVNDYYEYTYVGNYSIIDFKENIQGDILFLKENLATGQTWNSTEWTGTDDLTNQQKKLRYVFTCTDANLSASVTSLAGTKNFTNVYKITFKSQTSPASSSTWTDEGITWEALYSNNIGLVSLKGIVAGAPVYILPIRFWQVN